jgi:hypothetical protein
MSKAIFAMNPHNVKLRKQLHSSHHWNFVFTPFIMWTLYISYFTIGISCFAHLIASCNDFPYPWIWTLSGKSEGLKVKITRTARWLMDSPGSVFKFSAEKSPNRITFAAVPKRLKSQPRSNVQESALCRVHSAYRYQHGSIIIEIGVKKPFAFKRLHKRKPSKYRAFATPKPFSPTHF